MTDIRLPQLVDTIRATSDAYSKLTIIAGAPRSGKTHLLRQVAASLDLPIINLNLLLSQRLLGLNRRQRPLKVEETAIDIIDEHIRSGLCLDDTELLFDATMQMKPLGFLQDISRNRLIVATWNGALTGGRLTFGHTGHPDYFSQPITGCPVVSVAEERLELHLTT